jgi:DNA-binding NarL/FixJ family response regulator
MSCPFKVVIIEPSVLIRRGVLSVLQQLNQVQMDVEEMDDIDSQKNTLNWKSANLLIINPLIAGIHSLRYFRKAMTNPHTKFVALQTSLFDSSMLKMYDEVISIYDSFEIIDDKLTKLIKLIIDPDKIPGQLSQREKEVIACVVKGLTNKQIADKYNLSTHTVISHRRNIAIKLQIHTSGGLIIYAIVNKLIDLEDIEHLSITFNKLL